MDLSIGLDGYVFLGITPVGQDASSSTATGPNGPEEGGRVTTLASFDQSWIYARGFEGYNVRTDPVSYISKCLSRFADGQSLSARSFRWLSGNAVNFLQSSQSLARLKQSLGIKDQCSIAHLFQSSNGYKYLIDPFDVGNSKETAEVVVFGYKLKAKCSVAVGMAVGYQESEAQSIIDAVYETSDFFSPNPQIQKACRKYLRKICVLHDLPPSAMQIDLVDIPAGPASFHGGFADVYKCVDQGMEVAVKVIRVYSTSDMQVTTRRFYKEAITWNFLRHPNVLPLLGVPKDRSRLKFAMVSEWMANGTINKFVSAHREANRFKLLVDVANGLIYIHSQGVIHGDLKGDNILVDQGGNARLADFGMLTTSDASSYEKAGSSRWMSPELLDPEMFGLKDNRGTKSSDCYALGMVVYEVLSRRIPFYQHVVVAHRILGGERPERPQGMEGEWFTDDIWGILGHCWTHEPSDRPSVDSVLRCLEAASRVWTPLSPSLMEADPPEVVYSPTQSFSILSSIGEDEYSDALSNN